LRRVATLCREGLAGVALLGALTLACGDSSGEGGSSPPSRTTDSTLKVTLDEWEIDAPAEAASGAVELDVSNEGRSPHELLVVRSELPADQLPRTSNRADEDRLEVVGRLKELRRGESGRAALELAPGRYVLLCNIPGHYPLGMRTALTVR
jgi:uncharacterized cupredoxin-like copper-binding protein